MARNVALFIALGTTLLLGIGCGGSSDTGSSQRISDPSLWQGAVQADTRSLEARAEAATQANLLAEEKGRVTPDWTLLTADGDSLTLSSLRGRVVFLDFWDTWCPPCKRGIPELIELQKQYGSQGLTVVGLALGRDGQNAVTQYAQQNGMIYPVAFVGREVVMKYGGIQSIPTAFLIDQEGRARAMHVGYTPKEVLEKEILALLPQ